MPIQRMALTVLETSNLEAALAFYRDGLGLPLKMGENEAGDDRWLAGDHAEISWADKGYFHFALYEAKEQPTTGVQVGFLVSSIDELHAKMVHRYPANLIHGPRHEPWGKTARYYDPDRNVVSITEVVERA